MCNKNYKESKFSLKYLLEKYNEIKKPDNAIEFNEEVYNENFIIINERMEDFGIEINNINKKTEIMRTKSFTKTISNSMREKLIKNFFSENKNSILDLNNYLRNDTMIDEKSIIFLDDLNKNINTNLNRIENEDEKYLKNELSKLNNLNSFNEKIINNIEYKELNIFFNPKGYFLWKNFTIFFKDLIYNNKKFKKLSKVFEIYTRNITVKYSSKKDKEFFLNYPTKIKNYIIDDYYRPFLKPCLNFFNSKYIKSSHSYMKEKILVNPQFKEDNFNIIKFEKILPDLTCKEKEKIIKCERIQNRGNIFGYLLLKKY